MNLKRHYLKPGKEHAFLGASNYHWLRYSEDKLKQVYLNKEASERGTELHKFAAKAIELGIKLKEDGTQVPVYVNDCIDNRMTPEFVLYYSDNCYGTADAISFRNGVLKIFDLKTGITPAKMDQLEIYAALCCLDNDIDPFTISIELRIYQSTEPIIVEAQPMIIHNIMNKIVDSDAIIENMKGRSL